MNELLLTAVGLFFLAVGLLWSSGRLRSRTGLPRGKIIYTDTNAWRECVQPLVAASVNLAGKPDYLLQKWRYIIPVEVKTCQAPAEPYSSHLLQLAAYCFLVEEAYGRRPPYGLISYPSRTFSVKYTPQLEDELLDTLEWMRQDAAEDDVPRNHHDPNRCRACGFSEYCDQRLV